MEIVFLIIGIVAFIILNVLRIVNKKNSYDYGTSNRPQQPKAQWVSTEDFNAWKSRIKPNCSEMEFIAFRDFLSSYGGGFVKREYGRIVRQEYLGQEKGALKGIFYNVVVPNPHIEVSRKEEFRMYLISIGVNDVDKRPEYETRDTKLKNRATDADDRAKKDVGNKGEQVVRDILATLGEDYSVINGPVIKFGDVCKEYDHIVVGYNGVFVIETKAFGMTDGEATRASLFIDEGDKWIVRKNKKNREVTSPTEQIIEERELLKKLLASYVLDIYSIVALSNTELSIKNNIELPYEVLRADKLVEYISSKPVFLGEADRQMILTSLNNCRRN